jgi:hypothetical protein
MKYLTAAQESRSIAITIQVFDAAPDVPEAAIPGVHLASDACVAVTGGAATDKGISPASTVEHSIHPGHFPGLTLEQAILRLCGKYRKTRRLKRNSNNT